MKIGATTVRTTVKAKQKASDLTLVADNWGAFVLPKAFYIYVGDEIQLVTKITDLVATVVRGFGTTVVDHDIGTDIIEFIPVETFPTDPRTIVTSTTRSVIPMISVPFQSLSVSLNGQSCNLNVYQRTTGLYVDIGINNTLIIGGVLALDRTKIVRDAYFGFQGDIAFWDSQGTSDPNWTQLGSRFYLGYWFPT